MAALRGRPMPGAGTCPSPQGMRPSLWETRFISFIAHRPKGAQNTEGLSVPLDTEAVPATEVQPERHLSQWPSKVSQVVKVWAPKC